MCCVVCVVVFKFLLLYFIFGGGVYLFLMGGKLFGFIASRGDFVSLVFVFAFFLFCCLWIVCVCVC